MSILHIPKIPQYGVLIEKNDEIENSLFYEIYNGAANNVADIIDGQKRSENELFFNPCIAFVGKRGTGKSSAMCSFANLLEDTSDNSKNWIKEKDTKEKILKSKFYVLPAIDTANMGEKETILSNISSEMFNLYNSQSDKITIENKRRFIESTMKVNNTAMLKSSGEWTKQGDKLLVETDKVIHLKSLFEKMVEDFFTIVKNNSSSEDCYLVIQLDDLDMNIFNSFAIMEEIRNILSVKNIIVLLSVDIEQLKTVLKINFSESLHSKHNESVEKSTNKISEDLSYKYIEKLLPINRRHYMPELSIDQLKTHYSKNFLGDDDKNWYKMKIVSNEKDTPTILNTVLHLIWRKTMMIPMCNENGDYMLLPHNLRSLCNLVIFLRNMKDVALMPSFSDENKVLQLTYQEFSENELYRTTLEHNLRDFNKYIITSLEVYKAPEMNGEDEKLAEALITLIKTLSDVSLSELNRKIANDIIYCIKDPENNYYKLLNKNNTLDNIYKATAYADTISMGDILYLLGKIDRNTNCNYIRYLVEIIRTLWSIKMTAEIYVNGCNIKNADNLEPLSRFITKNFRNTVGAMIINPDTSESFLHSNKYKNHDWRLVRKDDAKRSIYDVVISKQDKGVDMIDDNGFSKYQWRMHLRTGEPIYKEHYSRFEHFLLSHPMLLFSNLLYPELLYTDLKVSKDEKIYLQWQNKYIMVLPFYSMDYMYRLYISFRKKIKSLEYSNYESIMKNVVDNMYYASNDLYEETKKYIPQITSDNLIDENNIHFTATDYILKTPLEKLISLVDWNKELLLVSGKTISKLEDFISQVEEIESICSSDEGSQRKDITQIWNSMIEHLNIILPKGFINKHYEAISYSDISHNEKIKELKKLIINLKGEGDINPYFYNESKENTLFKSVLNLNFDEKQDGYSNVDIIERKTEDG